MIDLRSDTLTKPTPAMLEAMMTAEVGDDVWNEDPTVRALESEAAAHLAQEAGLFCPSGTMANQIAIRVHTRPGDEVICSADAHIYNYEGGGIAANSGASVRLLPGDRGMFTAADVEANINNADDPHYPTTRLVAVEDTSNRGGGAVWDLDALRSIRTVTGEKSLALHVDGARLFNRLVATGDNPKTYGALFDSISICLSKGLGAPVGSLLLGSTSFIHHARRVRKMMGGGMRQVGYLAAAGRYALTHHVERLADDHRRARELADALTASSKVSRVLPVDTNIVIFHVRDEFGVDNGLAYLAENRVLASAMGAGRIRFVTHLDIDDDAIDRATSIIRRM